MTPILKKWVIFVLLTVLYFVSGKLGLSLAFVHASATSVWPPTAIALTAFLILGPSVWPAIFVGAFLVNITTAGSLATSLCIALGNTLEGLLGAYLVNRFAHGRQAFDHARDIFKFTLFAGFLSTTVSATLGVTSLALSGFAPWSHYGAIWSTWWLGDVTANLVVTPGLILWAAEPHIRWNRKKALERLVFALVIIVINQIVFNHLFSINSKNYPIAFFIIPPLILAAFRFTQRETATTTLILATIAIWGTLHGLGPFWRGTPTVSLFLLQSFLVMSSLMALSFASVISELRKEKEAVSLARQKLEERVQERTQKLKEAQEQTRLIIDTAKDAFIQIDAAGSIRDWNHQAEEFFGWSKSELLGKNLAETIIPPRFREAHQRGMAHFLKTGEGPVLNRTIEVSALHRDGHEFPVELTLWPLKIAEGFRFNAFCRDITERKRIEAITRELEEKKRLAELKDEFLGTVSHELRTPLAIISGSVSNLQDGIVGPLSKKQNQVVEMMSRNSKRLMRIIDNLLDLSRLEADNSQMTLQKINFHTFIQNLFSDFHPLFKEHGLTLTLDLPQSLPPLLADPDALRQVMENLLNNAIRYARDHVIIGVQFLKESPEVSDIPPGTSIQVCVVDDGPGIPQEQLGDLFNKFVQVNRPQGGGGYKGTGLGLAICKEIIRQHHGRIWAESKKDQGSQFYCVLPIH
ncbi:MAG: MASE1 domain-containing protein [Deltaproteobacteria bacterium]|nr:MASE1 domain-containing protein [Deltaproteobacteria bacterium]